MPKPYDPNEGGGGGYSQVTGSEDLTMDSGSSSYSSSNPRHQHHNDDAHDGLQESLILGGPGSGGGAGGTGTGGTSQSQSLQVTAATAMMQVTAPATLPEGYQFEARMGERTVVTVTVPQGGVEKGQSFSVPLPDTMDAMITGSGVHIPVGQWRDGLFDIFHYGVCHPAVWASCCCHLLAAGQVISRLRLTCTGRPGSVSETTGAFQMIFALVLTYCVLHFGGTFVSGFYDEDDLIALILDSMDIVLHAAFYIWTVVVLIRVRRQVRETYGIPATGNEDVCCSCFCPCFVAAQMLRHTTDYDIYPSTCCTETGIPAYAPSIV